jgi:acyl carrier protein
MTRDEIQSEVLRVFKEQFELREIEVLLGTQLTREEKKMAMDIRTINQILDYIESLAAVRIGKT